MALTASTSPTGLIVKIAGISFKAPITFSSWVGWSFQLTTPSSQGNWIWVKWSDGGARGHMVQTPATSTTSTATFRAN